jgi:hypothetical protein
VHTIGTLLAGQRARVMARRPARQASRVAARIRTIVPGQNIDVCATQTLSDMARIGTDRREGNCGWTTPGGAPADPFHNRSAAWSGTAGGRRTTSITSSERHVVAFRIAGLPLRLVGSP